MKTLAGGSKKEAEVPAWFDCSSSMDGVRHTRNKESWKLLPPKNLEVNDSWREILTYQIVETIHPRKGG